MTSAAASVRAVTLRVFLESALIKRFLLWVFGKTISVLDQSSGSALALFHTDAVRGQIQQRMQQLGDAGCNADISPALTQHGDPADLRQIGCLGKRRAILQKNMGLLLLQLPGLVSTA